MVTQNEQVLKHIKTYGYITPFDAWNAYNITRLSGRIFDLRKAGYDIITDMQKSAKGKYFAAYKLNEERSEHHE